jgi:UDP-GlcNAc3NAcA epimerase
LRPAFRRYCLQRPLEIRLEAAPLNDEPNPVSSLKLLTIVGARPQFIKSAALSRALVATGSITEVLVHTGQHFDDNLSGLFFRELGIREPDFNLGISGGSQGEMTGRMLEALDRCISAIGPDRVLVYGDTNSTLAGALAAAKLNIPVAHVEAGLRSGNRAMPEEINRLVTDHVSDMLFCPTAGSVENLRREGVTTGVYHVGDVMQDAFLHALSDPARQAAVWAKHRVLPGRYVLATVHRAENTASAERLSELLRYIADEAAGRTVLMPLHPRTRSVMADFGIAVENISFMPPVGYFDMVALTVGAALIMTDSGGLQKEAFFAGRPCITLRDETEWPETISHGWNRLWTVPDWAERRAIEDFGNGAASARIADILKLSV